VWSFKIITESGAMMRYAYFLFPTIFIAYLSNLMITPLFKNMALDLPVGIENLASLVTIYGIVAGSIALFAGPVSDKYGRKPILVMASIGTAIFSLLFALSWSFPTLIIFRVLTAVMAGPLMGCALAAIPDYIDAKDRGRAVGLMTSAVYMSSIVGVPVGLTLAGSEPQHWRWAFFLIVLLACMTAVALMIGLPKKAPANPNLKLHPVAIVKGYLGALSDTGRRHMCLTYACVYFAHGMYITFYPSYLMVNRSLTIKGLSVLFMCGGLLAFACTFIAGRIAKQPRRREIFLIATGFLSLAMLAILISAADASTIFFTALPIGLTYMASDAFRLTSLQLEALDHSDATTRGAFMGLLAFVTAASISAGAAFGGTFMAYAKLNWPTHQTPTLEAIAHPHYLHGYDLLSYIAMGFMLMAAFLLYRSRQVGRVSVVVSGG
jgi:MFS transporter, DHA1 family, inner membrane transport protein